MQFLCIKMHLLINLNEEMSAQAKEKWMNCATVFIVADMRFALPGSINKEY